MKLIIKGSANKVKRLENELRLRFKRDGLEVSIDVKDIEVKPETVEPIIKKQSVKKAKK